MEPDPGIAAVRTLQPTVGETVGGSWSMRATPATILLVGIWIGLTAGFLDLGLMILKKRLTGAGFYHLGDQFRWIIPAGVAVLVLLPGMGLALIAWVRRRAVPVGAAVGLLSFVGFLDVCARLPLELWASLLLSGGLAVQAASLAGARSHRFLQIVRRTSPEIGRASCRERVEA